MAIVVVDVALKPEILDPQGCAILGALGRVVLSGVADVRQDKKFILRRFFHVRVIPFGSHW